MSAADQLRAAKALIDTPEKWTQCGHFGEQRQGVQCYCAWGALGKAARGYGDALNCLHRALPDQRTLPAFNDAETTTHADIMALFDRAITLAEQQS